MSRQVQIRRGSAVAHSNFTGAIGEITMDTTNKTLRVHDGETVGGIKLAKQSEIPTVPDLTNADYVIESQLPTAENNYTWYRKYKSGWVEQGGIKNNGTTRPATITFPIEMQDQNYTVTIADCMSTTYLNAYSTWVYNRITTGFTYYPNGGGNGGHSGYSFSWQISGMSKN